MGSRFRRFLDTGCHLVHLFFHTTRLTLKSEGPLRGRGKMSGIEICEVHMAGTGKISDSRHFFPFMWVEHGITAYCQEGGDSSCFFSSELVSPLKMEQVEGSHTGQIRTPRRVAKRETRRVVGISETERQTRAGKLLWFAGVFPPFAKRFTRFTACLCCFRGRSH